MAKKHVRVDDDIYEAFQKISEETELSIARLANKAMREWLKKRQEKEQLKRLSGKMTSNN